MHRIALFIALICVSLGFADEEVALLGKKCPNPTLCPQECQKKDSSCCPPKAMPCKPCKQGDDPLPDDQYLPSYNAPASVALKNRTWNFYVDGSYIYWLAGEEGLTLAYSRILSGASVFNIDVTTIDQPFQYQSGFKAGLGVAGDNGTLDAKYTWIRQKTSVSSDAPAHNIPGTTDIWDSPWFVDTFLFGSDLDSEWTLQMDLVDLTVGRPYYQGPFITVAPFVGLRGAFIRQYLHLHETSVLVPGHVTETTVQHSNNLSHSWGIGPRSGLTASCLCMGGFRVFGNIAASLLFTQYTKLAIDDDLVSSDFRAFSRKEEAAITNLNVLRPALETGLGIGWGFYTPSQNFHFDIEASYDFSFYWNQNMMRYLVDSIHEQVAPSANNLYLQGLTVTAGFTF